MAAYLTAPKEEGDEMIGVVRPRTSQLEVVTWLEYGDGVVCVLWLRLRHEGASTPSGPAACNASSPTLSFFFFFISVRLLCLSFVLSDSVGVSSCVNVTPAFGTAIFGEPANKMKAVGKRSSVSEV